MTDNKPVRLTAGLAKKVDRFFNLNRSQMHGTPPRPDEPGPRRATVGTPIGQGEVGEALMLGLNIVVPVYNGGPTIQGDVPIYWSAGNEVSTALDDLEEGEAPKRGQWEVFVPSEPTTGSEPASPVGNPAEVDCDCNRMVIGQEIDCAVCPCGNVFRWTYFPELSLPPASVEDPPTVWEDSGGLKRWRHMGECVWETEEFEHPVCEDDTYIYRLTLTADTPPTGVIELVRTGGDGCEGDEVEVAEVSATWCLSTKAGCEFECFGVWQFVRSRPWTNVTPSSLACQLCVTPRFPKRRESDGTSSDCACGASISRPVRVVGPPASIAQMEAHGFVDVALFTQFLGWDVLWETSAPTKVEIIGTVPGEGPPSGGGSPEPCTPNHVQYRGTDGEVGVPAPVIWSAQVQFGEGTVDMVDGVTISVRFTVHVDEEGAPEDTAFWFRDYAIDLTCEEFAEVLDEGYVLVPHIEDSDEEGTTAGPLTGPVRVMLDGTYPPQEEPTTSTSCGPPDACADQGCWIEVYENEGENNFWGPSSETTCTSDCENACDDGCDIIVHGTCGNANAFEAGHKCLVGACVSSSSIGGCSVPASLTATIGESTIELTDGVGLGGGTCDEEGYTLDLTFTCDGGCPQLAFSINGGTCTGIAQIYSLVSRDPIDVEFVINPTACCSEPINIQVTE